MTRGWFVTGTDTEVGKTMVSAAMLHRLVSAGQRAVGMKPVASGAEPGLDGLRNADALLLQRHSNVAAAYEQVNPYCFEPPIAPHVAAARVGCRMSLKEIVLRYGELTAEADCAVVEGVGGWRVPLNDELTMATVARQLELPVVLVVGIRLGCINHALLTAESVLADGCRLAGWVANDLSDAPDAIPETMQALAARLPAPCWGVLPWLGGDDVVAALAARLNWKPSSA